MWLALLVHQVGSNDGSRTRDSLAAVNEDLVLFLGVLLLAGQSRLFLLTLASIGLVFVRVEVGTLVSFEASQ